VQGAVLAKEKERRVADSPEISEERHPCFFELLAFLLGAAAACVGYEKKNKMPGFLFALLGPDVGFRRPECASRSSYC